MAYVINEPGRHGGGGRDRGRVAAVPDAARAVALRATIALITLAAVFLAAMLAT